MLGKLCISRDLGDVENPSFTLLCSDVNLSAIIGVYGGLIFYS